VNAVASSVASTAKLFSAPSCSTVAMPAGIDGCRKPVVLVKTSARNAGSSSTAAAVNANAGRSPITRVTIVRMLTGTVRLITPPSSACRGCPAGCDTGYNLR
jgi:hypothetical protein